MNNQRTHAQIGQQFQTQAADYEKGRRPYSQEVFDLVVKIVQERVSTKLEEIKVLDIGCGTGISTRELYKNGFKNVQGMDISEGMLLKAIEAAKNGNEPSVPLENYLVGDIGKEKDIAKLFHHAKFDLITAFSAFHWFCSLEAINNIKAILKAKGYFIAANARRGNSEFKNQFWNLIASLQGSPVRDPQEGFEGRKLLEEGGFTVEEYCIERETKTDFENAVARCRSFSGWCNLSEEQKAKGDKDLQQLVRDHIAKQNHSDGKLHATHEEVCLVATLKA